MQMEKNILSKRIQSLCLPSYGHFETELYFRGKTQISASGEDISSKHAGMELIIPKGGTVSFDTYFNMLSLLKWKKYTTLRSLCVKVTLKGEARVDVFGLDKDESALYSERRLASVFVNGESQTAYTVFSSSDIPHFPDFMYVSVTALGSYVELKDVEFCADASNEKELNVACCFCTYKREKEIKGNVRNLLEGVVHNKSSLLYEKCHIYVADNGQTLPLDMYKTEPVFHLFYNANYGGSAGFTRCMIESCLRSTGKPFTHVILMDDDALILPQVIERTAAFLSLLKPEYSSYILGGSLMLKELPFLQKENGGFLDVKQWHLSFPSSYLDMRDKGAVLKSESSPESEVNYNAWWYACIPAGLITQDNLPLPLFLHGDDEEYGLRNGGKLIRLNGVCVWHPNVHGAGNQRAYMSYYDDRNALIVQSAYYEDKSSLKSVVHLLTRCASYILRYRYQCAHYACLAFRDFYDGIDAFKSRNAQSLNASLLKRFAPFTSCTLSKEKLSKSNVKSFNDLSKTGSARALKNGNMQRLLRWLINWFIPALKGRAVYSSDVPFEDIDFLGTREVCVVDPETGRGLRFKKSYLKAFIAALDCMLTCAKICIRHKRVYKKWHDGLYELKSYDFWRKYLGI